MPRIRAIFATFLAAAAGLGGLPCGLHIPAAGAQGFAALVSPPRFEVVARPGERIRQVVEITNASPQPANFRLRTADWSLDANAAVTFDDALKPGSCRPWVAIERRELTIPGSGRYRYRFEVAPPADAPAGECRFALLIEGDDQSVMASGGFSFPVSGRIGIIVYVQIGDAAPKLDVVASQVATVNGEQLPVLMVRNSGNAHGRVAGFLSGTDAAGTALEFTPATLPILPGETRAIPLAATRERDTAAKVVFPVTIRGNLEWSDQRVPFEQRFAP